MAPSAILLLCLLALASAAPQHDLRSRARREINIDTIMPEICTLSQGQGDKQLAPLMSQAIELFRDLPGENSLLEISDKISTGVYCADYSKLESLFLDAVAFVGTPGAFKFMAEELLVGRTTGGRLSLYTVALNLLTQPTQDHVAAITPIFGKENTYQLPSLAASTVLNRYCSQNPDCLVDGPVSRIHDILVKKLKTQCTPDFSKQGTLKVLTTLKVVGNIGEVDPDMFDAVMQCASTEGIEKNVRFAALMSLKGASCDKQMTKSLLAKTVELDGATDIRIGSYLAAVRCAEAEDFAMLIKAMDMERDRQVRGFILSHLENLQETNWPLKQTLREILVSFDVPEDYMSNLFKDSRNFELSASSPALEVGGLVESNIVYTAQSYVPRLVNLGLNMNLLGSFINIGELGARVEGSFPLLEQFINTFSYIINQPIFQTIEGLKYSMEDIGADIIQQIQQFANENNISLDSFIKALDGMKKNIKSVDVEMVLKALNDFVKNAENVDINSALKMVDFDSIVKYILNFINNNKFELPKVDLYAILRDQDRAFLSFGGEKQQFTIRQIIDTVVPIIVNAISSAQNIDIDTSRIGQFNVDYTLPSVNGMPLRLRLKGTGVAGLQMRNNISFKPGAADAILKIIPSFSGQIELQINYGENEGVKLKGNVYTTNGFSLNVAQKGENLELQIDLPEKMELLNVEIETDMTKNKGMINNSNQCIGFIESVTGLLVCYETKIQQNSLAFRTYFERSDSAMKGYRLAAKFKNKPKNKLLKITAGTYGSADSKESSLTLSYTKQKDTYLVATKFQSSLIESLSEVTFINEPEYKSLQYYCSDKIGTGISLEGSVKIDFKVVPVNNGKSYEIATYAGLAKLLTEKNRLFQVKFSVFGTGDNTAVTFLAKTDLLPVTFEAGIELPQNAGLRIYKVERIALISTVSSMEVEWRFTKKSSEVYETVLNFKKSGTSLASFSVVNTIAIESPLTGFEALKLNLMTRTKAKFPMMEFELNTKFMYENGAIDTVTQLRYNDSGISTIKSNFKYRGTGFELTTKASCLDSMCFFFFIKLNLDIKAPFMMMKIGVPAADVLLQSKFTYADGVVKFGGGAEYQESDIFNAYITQSLEFPLTSKGMVEIPNLFLIDISQTIDSSGITSEAKVNATGIIKPLEVNSAFVISDIFSYSFFTELLNGDEVVLRAEGPLTFTFSPSLLQEKLDVEISGAFDGNFNVNHEFTVSSEKSQYKFNVRHTNTPIVILELVSEITKPGTLQTDGKLEIPFVFQSEQRVSITIVEDYMQLYMWEETSCLPSTEYAHKSRGYMNIDLVEDKFEFRNNWNIWSDDSETDKIVGSQGDFTLKLPQFELVGKNYYSAFNDYGARLEVTFASPLDWFQGNSKMEITFTETTPDIYEYSRGVIKSMIDIQYSDSKVTVTPLFSIITDFGNSFEKEEKFKVSSSLVAEHLPAFLNFDVTYETTLTVAKLQPITLVSKLSHKDEDEFGKLLFKVTLKESVLNEECSFIYSLESKPEIFKRIIRMQYGTKIIKLNTEIVPPQYEINKIGLPVNTGEPFGITYELILPLVNVKSLKAKLWADRGLIELVFWKNEKQIVKLFYNKPTVTSFASLFTNHNVGLESNSRKMEFRSELEENQLTFKLFPESNKGNRALEAYLKVSNLKANVDQFEAIINAPSQTKRIGFAVELVENGKDEFYHVNVNVNFYDTPELLFELQKELKNIYIDLIHNDGLLPDFEEWYYDGMPMHLPEFLNNIQDQFAVMLTNFYYYCYQSVTDVYFLYKDDFIAFWEKIQSDVPVYMNIIKTELPVFFKSYMETIKNTETWNAVQALLNKIIINYPAYYEYMLEFYNKVIVKYFKDLSKAVNRILALSKSDIAQYLAIVQKEVSTILNNFISQFKKTQGFKLLQKKYFELSSGVKKFLKSAYPAVFDIIQDIYQKVILSTFKDVKGFINNVTKGPIDFQKYSEQIKTDFPTIALNFISRILETKIAKEIKSAYPTVFEVVIDFNNKVFLPLYDDVYTILQEFISLPISDHLVLSSSTMAVLKKVPPMANKFVERLPDTQLVSELKTFFPTFMDVTLDFYKVVLLPTYQDVRAFLKENCAVSLRGILANRDECWELIKTEIPTLVIKFIQRIPNTHLIYLLQTNFDQFSSIVQNKFEELKAQNPELYSVGLDFYMKVVVPAIDDIPAIFNKILRITDPNQLINFVENDVLMFFKKMISNITTTDLYNKIMTVLGQLEAAYPDEYNAIIKLYKTISKDVKSTIDLILSDYFYMSFGSGTFTVLFPLPVTPEIVRKSSQFAHDFMKSSLSFTLHVYSQLLDLVQDWIGYIEFQFINNKHYLQHALDIVQELPDKVTNMVDDIWDSLPEDDDEFFDPLEELIEDFLDTPYGKFTEQFAEKLFELIAITYNEFNEHYPKEAQAFEDFVTLCMEKLEVYLEAAFYKIIDIMVMFEVYKDLAEDAVEVFIEPAITGIVDHPLVQQIINYISTLSIEKAQYDLMAVYRFVSYSIQELVNAMPTEVIAFFKLHVPNFVFEQVNIVFFLSFVLLDLFFYM